MLLRPINAVCLWALVLFHGLHHAMGSDPSPAPALIPSSLVSLPMSAPPAVMTATSLPIPTRSVCEQPQGLAYGPAHDLYIACSWPGSLVRVTHDGQLSTVTASWPDGCRGASQVALDIPRNHTYVICNDATQPNAPAVVHRLLSNGSVIPLLNSTWSCQYPSYVVSQHNGDILITCKLDFISRAATLIRITPHDQYKHVDILHQTSEFDGCEDEHDMLLHPHYHDILLLTCEWEVYAINTTSHEQLTLFSSVAGLQLVLNDDHSVDIYYSAQSDAFYVMRGFQPHMINTTVLPSITQLISNLECPLPTSFHVIPETNTVYIMCIGRGISKFTSGVIQPISTSMTPNPCIGNRQPRLTMDSQYPYEFYVYCDLPDAPSFPLGPYLFRITDTSVTPLTSFTTCSHPNHISLAPHSNTTLWVSCSDLQFAPISIVSMDLSTGRNTSYPYSSGYPPNIQQNPCMRPVQVVWHPQADMAVVACYDTYWGGVVTINNIMRKQHDPHVNITYTWLVPGTISTSSQVACPYPHSLAVDLSSDVIYVACGGESCNTPSFATIMRVAWGTPSFMTTGAQCFVPYAIDYYQGHNVIIAACRDDPYDYDHNNIYPSLIMVGVDQHHNYTVTNITTSTTCSTPTYVHIDQQHGQVYATCAEGVITMNIATPQNMAMLVNTTTCASPSSVDVHESSGWVYITCLDRVIRVMTRDEIVTEMDDLTNPVSCLTPTHVDVNQMTGIIYVACYDGSIVSIHPGWISSSPSTSHTTTAVLSESTSSSLDLSQFVPSTPWVWLVCSLIISVMINVMLMRRAWLAQVRHVKSSSSDDVSESFHAIN